MLSVDLVSGGTLSLPADLAGSYAVILFYRGSWCPYCSAQLAAFSRFRDAFQGAGIRMALGILLVAAGIGLTNRGRRSRPRGRFAEHEREQTRQIRGRTIGSNPQFLERQVEAIHPDGR